MDAPQRPGWFDYALAAAAIALLLTLCAKGCEKTPQEPHAWPLPPAPTQGPTPGPSATPTPPPEVKAEAHQEARVIIRRRPALPGQSPEPDEIEVILKQDTAVKAPVIVITPPPPTPAAIPQATPDPEMIEHTRVGVVTGSLPGMLAADLQVVRGRPLAFLGRQRLLPADVARVEVSVDLIANHKAAGVMAAAGSKVFVGAGGYAGYDLTTGTFVAVGMRF